MKKIFFLSLIFIFIFLQKGITEEIKVFDFTQEELKKTMMKIYLGTFVQLLIQRMMLSYIIQEFSMN